MKRSTWAGLSAKDKDKIYYRVKEEGADPIKIAQKLNMKPQTLKRRLREWKNIREVELSLEESEKEQQRDEENKLTKINAKYQDRNNLTVTASGNGERIITKDDLLAALQLDMDVWKLNEFESGTWEGYRKDERKYLYWEDGRISGTVEDDGGIATKTLWRTKAKFIRISPLPVNPVIKPVKMNVKPFSSNLGYRLSTELNTALIVPDLHVGFIRDLMTGKLTNMHDRVAMSILLKIAGLMDFDEIIYLGDLLDLAEWSDRFARSPDFEMTTMPAILELCWWLGQIKTLQQYATQSLLEGNHEKRIPDKIIKHVPAAYNIRSTRVEWDFSSWELPNLLDLGGLGIEWIGDYPNGEVWLNDYLKVIHGDTTNAKKILDDHRVKVIFGHLHRYERVSKVIHGENGSSRMIEAVCPGFLGHTDGRIPARRNQNDWTQGFAVVYYDDEYSEIMSVPIDDGKAIFMGNYIEGEDWTDKIRKDTGIAI